MDKMMETETSNARTIGRLFSSSKMGSPARMSLVKGGLLGGVVALLGLLSFAAGKSTSNGPTDPPPAPPRQDVRVADRIHQQGPRSHRLVPFRVTQSGTIDMVVQVFDKGDAEVMVIPGSETENLQNTLSNPLFGPGYKYFPGFSGQISADGHIRGYLDAGSYCAVLLNKAWFSDIKTWTVVVQNPKI